MTVNLPSRATSHARWPLLCLLVLSLLLAACSGQAQQAKTYRIGVLNYTAALESVLDGFKAKMTEFGYIEGENLTYVYHGALKPELQVMEQEVESLMDQKVDLFLTLGNLPTLTAKQAVEGTNIPVVFAPVINPIEAGAVESINHPGGNLTGIQLGSNTTKALEWLHKLAPNMKQIYVFYRIDNSVRLDSIKPLLATASTLGIELVPTQVQSPEEAAAIIATLDKDVGLLVLPTPNLAADILTAAGVKRSLAIAGNGNASLVQGALVAYIPDLSEMGGQAARMADQIFKGTKPGDIPVETGESTLSISLKSAQAIGLEIPDALLAQAKTVIR